MRAIPRKIGSNFFMSVSFLSSYTIWEIYVNLIGKVLRILYNEVHEVVAAI
jgi:hypothetical protein